MSFVSSSVELQPNVAVVVFGPILQGSEGCVTINVCTASSTPVPVKIQISKTNPPTLASTVESAVEITDKKSFKLSGQPICAGESIFVTVPVSGCSVRVAGPINEVV